LLSERRREHVGKPGKKAGARGRLFAPVPGTRDRKRTAAAGKTDRNTTAAQTANGSSPSCRDIATSDEIVTVGVTGRAAVEA
jgi:hypothetical protein